MEGDKGKSKNGIPGGPSIKDIQTYSESWWHAVASWTWDAQDETCGICRMAFDGCCPDCKIPGDDCPLNIPKLASICLMLLVYKVSKIVAEDE
nr:Anaphase-promoting complex subunit 11 [Ipomoea batatas]